MLRRLICLLLLLVSGASSAENLFRGYTVDASTSAAYREDLGEFFRYAVPGDVITLQFYAKEGFTMVSSELSDPTGIGWTMTALGRFRVVIPPKTELNSVHAVEFFGKLKKDQTPGGAGGETKEEWFWGVKGKLSLSKPHEGIGSDKQRKAADITFKRPASPSEPVTGAPARFDPATDKITSSVEGDELGYYDGTLRLNPQIESVNLPPNKVGPCPQHPKDKADQVTFVFQGAKAPAVAEVTPDTITIDDRPIWNIKHETRLGILNENWNKIVVGTIKHERQHREKAYTAAKDMASVLSKMRVFGYSKDPVRAAELADTAFTEICSSYITMANDLLEVAQNKFDVDTHHGRQ